jgi:hypothetical protein
MKNEELSIFVSLFPINVDNFLRYIKTMVKKMERWC